MKALNPADSLQGSRIAVVVPCYKVSRHIGDVIDAIGPEVSRIYCVDDACPDGSGDFIERNVTDPRVTLIRHEVNQGVGGAVMTGYIAAASDGMDVVVKIDGDGQMDPTLIPAFVQPIVDGSADYAKGNRFWDLSEIRQMPVMRRIGNLGLSFITKASSGYWDIFDPTNGYTAISAAVIPLLPLESISKRYFFESDLLFRLNVARAVVLDVPMHAKYGDETSNLHVSKVMGEFAWKNARNYFKRIAYSYFLRDLPFASFELLFGAILSAFGAWFGLKSWILASAQGANASAGTVMIAGLSLLSGLQLILAFISHDTSSMPRNPIHRRSAYTARIRDAR